jgi:PEGA domain
VIRADATASDKLEGVPVRATASNLTINSTPIGADIYLDQNFVGNTPSTITVPPGKHSVAVRKPGFQDWVRDANFSGGTVTLNGELVSVSKTTAPVAASAPQTVDTGQDVSVAEAARLNKAAKTKENQPRQQ